jgi:leucyl/phenylalanyl-tRNA--protein transferase
MSILPPSRFFPPVESADRDGLLAYGGSLTPEWLLDAYRHAIFPWPMTADGEPILWWSPDPRAIVELEQLRVSRRLRRTCRQEVFRITFDQAFAAVIRGCACVGDRASATWLTPAMIAAYVRLHQLGYAHSVEAWDGDRLAGGIYGVAIAGLFSAESMFHRRRDASKVALVHLVSHLRRRGYRLLDIQQLTSHMARMGATEIPRQEYLARLAAALDLPVVFGS